MKRILFTLLLMCSIVVQAQTIVTANDFFNTLSKRYEEIEAYKANVSIAVDSTEMSGTLYVQQPGKIRIDFTQPQNQVLVSDGRTLKIYLPGYRQVLTQDLSSTTDSSNLASAKGLRLMRDGYFIAYYETDKLVPLEEGSGVKVTKLRLTWKSTNQGFRYIILSVGQNGYIRRIEAETVQQVKLEMNFTNIELNEYFADEQFEYEEPANASIFNNFVTED